MSGRSSRSSLMQTNSSFMSAAVSASSNDSRSITWHQWQAEDPIDSRIGRSSGAPRPRASSPQPYQATGLSLCWSRYGEVSSARRLAIAPRLPGAAAAQECTPDLAAGRLGQLRREVDQPRVLVGRRLLLDVLLQLARERLARLAAGLEHHHGAH